jgi:DNA-binding XRE family transcriptional regulator
MARANRDSGKARGSARLASLPRYVASARRTLSLNLKRERARRGMSQERTAEAAEFSLQYFQRIEQGIVNVPLDTVARLAHALNVEPHVLLGARDE